MANLTAVLVSAIVAYIIGALWYSPVLFGNLWIKLSKLTKKDLAKMKKESHVKSYVLGFVTNLVTAYVLAVFLRFTGAATAAEGVVTAFWLWLGFVATFSLGAVLWEGRSSKLWALNGAYSLVMMSVMGAILAVW